MVSNIELEYKTLEETNGWRDIFQVNHFNNSKLIKNGMNSIKFLN